jgi:hypothetical protein
MTCVRCEIIRAKAIAIGMGGLRRTVQQIADELRNRYGVTYYRDGRRVMRTMPTGDVLIYEGWR